ncbi:MAG: zinc-binding alcohol dehydrogenase [Proteobacteria bacterium]|nr:zinc-binding alcohol dehydrogenase [Pseudomonadota bacterium]
MAVTAQALWYVGPGQARIEDEMLGPLAAGAVRIRARHGAVSRGTESLVAAGRVPPSEYQRMRAPFMAGDFPFPVKYGYATVGTLENGQTVFALHPHQTVFDVPAEMAVPVPANVPASRAVLGANMETALNAVWDAGGEVFGKIAVVGAGVVGTLTGFLCRMLAAAEVTLVDINPARARVAEGLGLRFALPDRAPAECDLVFHASTSSAGLATALGLARDEATIIELSWYGTTPVSVPLGGAFHSRRLKLVASQVGMVAPSHRRQWTHRRRLEKALSLLADRRLDVLLEPAVRFADLPVRLPTILSSTSSTLCQVIDYPEVSCVRR